MADVGGFAMRLTQVSQPTVHRLVLRELLNPRQWRPSEDRKFALDAEQINELCDAAERIFKDEPSVLRLKGAATRFRQMYRCMRIVLIQAASLLCHLSLAGFLAGMMR